MRLEAARDARARPPVYGPYDLVAPEYDSPRGAILKGELGHHYGQLIADGSTSVIDQVVTQVESFARYEPFLGWGREQVDDEAYVAAYGFEDKTGLSFVGGRVLAETVRATSLDDVAAATAGWGFGMYLLVDWSAGGGYTERLVVWPRHPLLRSEPGGLGLGDISYAVQPRVGQVLGWTRGAPTAFLAPNHDLDNLLIPTSGSWKQRPTVAVPEVLNSPAHLPATPHNAAWHTRRIISGRRSLSGQSGFEAFHTGGPVPPPAFWIEAAAANARLAKGVEELQRWDWQNEAAVFTGVRYPDLSAGVGEVAVAPHQLLQVPAGDLPPGWDPAHRLFTVRTVRHEWDPTGGYRQNVEGTLWQGPFARLTATAVTQE